MKTSMQLNALIRNLSAKKNVEAGIILRNFMQERLLERISISEYIFTNSAHPRRHPEDFIIKSPTKNPMRKNTRHPPNPCIPPQKLLYLAPRMISSVGRAADS